MPLSLLSDAFAIYACDSFGDDTDNDLIWENLDGDKDLVKGDGSTSSTFPTFVTNSEHGIAYYQFDGSNDYVDGWPVATGSGYFVSAALSDSYPDGYPYITQVTDDSLKALLTTPGSFAGNLHSLIFFETEPTTAEKKQIADYQLRQMWREQWVDPYFARMIRDGDCVLYCDFEHPENLYNDYSGVSTITPTGCDWDHGLELSGAGAYVTAPDDPDLRLGELTIFVATKGIVPGTYIEKTGNYVLDIAMFNNIGFNGTYFTGVGSGEDSLYSFAITADSDVSLDAYWDGKHFESETPVTITSTGTADVVVGDDPSVTLYKVAIFNRVLTADEIKLLHYATLLNHDLASKTVRARILDVDGDNVITSTQTNVVINCLDAGTTQGNVYLTGLPIFDENVQRLAQSIDSWSDNSIQFDVTLEDLTCVEGDSISVGWRWPNEMREVDEWGGKTHYNFAVASDTAVNMDANFDTGPGQLLLSSDNYAALMAGTNDLALGSTDTTVIAARDSLASKFKQRGYTLVEFDILPSMALTGSEETYRQSVNASRYATGDWDYWINTPTTLSDPSWTKYIYDGVHPSKPGSQSLAYAVETAINAYPVELNCGYEGADSLSLSGNILIGIGYEATKDQYSNKIRVYASTPGNAYIGLYDGSASGPVNLISRYASPISLTSGWDEITFTGNALNSSEWYFIGIITDVTLLRNAADNLTEGCKLFTKTATYSGFSFPDPFGTPNNIYLYDTLASIYGHTV